MRNHREKTKDMAESVLPSTGRRRARTERRRIHRAQRARERIMLSSCDLGGVDEYEPDFREGHRLSATEWMVWDRRAADKIGSLTRWAAAVVRADPNLREADIDVQVEHFARLFPDNLIGRHAVQHIGALSAEISRSEWQDRCLAVAKQREEHRSRLTCQLRRIIESGRHGALNAELRRHYQWSAVEDGGTLGPPPARYLLGVHDVDAFGVDMAPYGGVRALVANLVAEIG